MIRKLEQPVSKKSVKNGTSLHDNCLIHFLSLSPWDKVPAPCDSLGITDRWLYLNRPVCSENPGLLRFLKTTFSFFSRVFTCCILNLSFFVLWHFCNRFTGDQFSESSLTKKPHTSSIPST